ncbi:TVP38/TMEM64 family protein [Salsuginibacillus kocurii]|uniref:TVP38/TMEM64 family protein n=1 Tax=Salsuginibacillus kocurii TaxID=427078 RepID=UPI00037FD1CE|nr:TVP38/TMEM64 family protein [Salsuginibacillus kocurii]
MRKITVVLWLLLLVGAGLFVWFNRDTVEWQPELIRNWLLSFGWWAPFLYILFYTLRPLIFFPASIYAMAGGLAFGPFGVIFVITGSLLGSTLAFWLARYGGYSIVKKQWSGWRGTVQKQLEVNGFYYVLFLRMIPVLNFDIVSYISGISRIRYRTFIGATSIGIIPGSFGYTFLGASVVETDPWIFSIGALLILLLVLLPNLLRKRMKRAGIDLPEEEQK